MSRFARDGDLIAFLSGWPRRSAAVVCLFLAAASLVLGHHSHPSRQHVVVAVRALAAGTALRAEDLRIIAWPDDAPPSDAAHSVSSLLGQRTALALARGAPIGANALLVPAVARALANGQVAATIQLANADELVMIRSGSYVDLYPSRDSTDLIEGKPISNATGSGSLASSVLVLAALTGNSSSAGNTNPTLVIAVSRLTAAKLSAPASATFVATLAEPP